MQLLHQTCKSRIDRLNVGAVIGGSSGKYGAQHRFNAPTSSSMSSVLQKRYEEMRQLPSRLPESLCTLSGLTSLR